MLICLIFAIKNCCKTGCCNFKHNCSKIFFKLRGSRAQSLSLPQTNNEEITVTPNVINTTQIREPTVIMQSEKTVRFKVLNEDPPRYEDLKINKSVEQS